MNGISILAYLVLALSIGYAFIYPSMGDISALTAEKQKYNDSLEMVSNIESKKNELLAKFDSIPEEDKKEINTILPTSFDFVRLISQIDAVAARNGMSIDKISSKEIGSAVGNSIEEAGPQKPYRSAVIGFSFESSYEKFNVFINDLEKSLRILDVRSIKLNAGEKGTYSYDVEFETYWLK